MAIRHVRKEVMDMARKGKQKLQELPRIGYSVSECERIRKWKES